VIIIWRGAGCLAFLLGIGLLALSAFVGFGLLVGIGALVGGLLCWAVGKQGKDQGDSLYFIPLHYWGVGYALLGLWVLGRELYRWLESGKAPLAVPNLEGYWGWLGLGCGGLAVVAVAFVVAVAVFDSRKRNRIIREGDHTMAWLVHANEKLFREGLMDDSALALISPDRQTANDPGVMTAMADRVAELKGCDPAACFDRDEARVAALLRDATYVEGKRDRLPSEFARGREVYLAHLYVYRDHLPDRKIQQRALPCAVIWHEPKAMICTRPLPPAESGDDGGLRRTS
jgi:hypothetical protein